MTTCPVCTTACSNQRAGTPYFTCPGCGAWRQDPMPAKVYQHPDEHDLEALPEADVQANRALAGALFTGVMGRKAGWTLDIGAKHPVLAGSLKALGCMSFAIDGVGGGRWGGVTTQPCDFEAASVERLAIRASVAGYHLVTMIHVFEHMYDPLAAMRKLRAIVADDGAVFLRLPDHTVPGYERDLTQQHFTIHPFYHCLASVAECCAQTGAFVVAEQTALLPGQRDIVLRPLS